MSTAAAPIDTKRKGRRRALRSAVQVAPFDAGPVRSLESVAIEGLAESIGVTPRDVVAMMPAEMRRLVSPRRFMEVMDDLTTWGELTVVLRTIDGCIEFRGEVPKGEISHGYFRWIGDGAIRGYLRRDRCSSIAFVERTFMGRASAFVLFFNRAGEVMFKAVVSRDERNEPRDDQLKAFRSLATRVAWPHEG